MGPGNFDDDDDGSPDPACGTAAPDCDDENPNVRPGKPELCDGLDNDCNGVADTQTQSVLWYADTDGDGWGNPLVEPIDSCDAVPGRVTQVGDCDDRDPDRNPSQPDDCTGIPGFDDNCNGIIDEDEEAIAYYADADGDGYGELGSNPLYRCQRPAGWAPVSSDCDDTNEDISPLNTEVCTPGDGFDDDCDGFLDCADPDCNTDEDCLGLFTIALESPSTPVVALLATPFSARVSVRNSIGDPQVSFDLDVTCSGGAVTTTPTVQTDDSGEATITLYPGLAQGLYSCYVSDALDFAVPLTINIQAVAPAPGTIQTVFNLAGINGFATAGPALTSRLYTPRAVKVGADGTAYILDSSDQQIWAVSPRGIIAGLLDANQKGQLGSPFAMTIDKENNVLYIAGSGSSGAIFSYNIDTGGMVRILGGGPTTTTYYEGIQATDIDIGTVYGVHYREGIGVAYIDSLENIGLVRPDGSLYIWPHGNCGDPQPSINFVTSTGSGIALTETGALLSLANWCEANNTSNGNRLARLGPADSSREILSAATGGGGNVPLAQLLFGIPKALEFDDAGNLLVADDHRLRLIDREAQFAYDLAGGQVAGSTGDYGQATAATLNDPRDVSVAPDGSIWIVTEDDDRVRRIWRPQPTSTVSSVNMSLTSAPPTATSGYPTTPVVVEAEDQDGNPLEGIPVVFEGVASSNTSQGPYLTSAAGLATTPLTSSMVPGLYDFTAVSQDLHGVVVATLPFQMSVSDPPDGTITSIINTNKLSGTLTESNWAPIQTSTDMDAMAVGDDGTIYLADGSIVFALYTDGSLRHIAGGGNQVPDGVSAKSANLSTIETLAYDGVNNRLFIMSGSYYVTFLDLDGGIITMIDNSGPILRRGVVSPDGTEFVYTKTDGVYVADVSVYPPVATQLIATDTQFNTCDGFPNRPYFGGIAGDHGLAYGTDGLVYVAGGLCVGTSSTMYDAFFTIDTDNGFTTQPEIDGVTNIIGTLTHSVAANMAFDAQGWLYYSNFDGDSVNRWNLTGPPQFLAGVTPNGSAGDLGPANQADLNGPLAVGITPDGDVLIADSLNHTIRKIWMPEAP